MRAIGFQNWLLLLPDKVTVKVDISVALYGLANKAAGVSVFHHFQGDAVWAIRMLGLVERGNIGNLLELLLQGLVVIVLIYNVLYLCIFLIQESLMG